MKRHQSQLENLPAGQRTKPKSAEIPAFHDEYTYEPQPTTGRVVQTVARAVNGPDGLIYQRLIITKEEGGGYEIKGFSAIISDGIYRSVSVSSDG